MIIFGPQPQLFLTLLQEVDLGWPSLVVSQHLDQKMHETTLHNVHFTTTTFRCFSISTPHHPSLHSDSCPSARPRLEHLRLLRSQNRLHHAVPGAMAPEHLLGSVRPGATRCVASLARQTCDVVYVAHWTRGFQVFGVTCGAGLWRAQDPPFFLI